jgi:hypothetical protein
MAYSSGSYTYTMKDPSFTSGALVYIAVNKNDSGAEAVVPGGNLGTVTSWSSFNYAASSSSSTSSSSSSSSTSTSSSSSTSGTPVSKTWYLYNTSVSGVSPAGQNLQTSPSSLTGWQPITTVSTTAKYWYSDAVTGTANGGTWQFILWSNNPGSSTVQVDIYKVASDGTGAVLLGSKSMDAGNSGLGNHGTTYAVTVSAASFANQRLLVKITKTAGADLTMVYNGNDFPTKLLLP